jgi:hypothetical protein
MRQSELIQILSESASQFSWLLGAGTSQSAGLPTATDLLWDLKRRHYCKEENQDIASNDVENAAVREKIDAFMRAHGFPSFGDPDEYSKCFELIFGDDHERQRAYLRAILDEKRISLTQGHRVLAALVAMNKARSIFTTNFDSVVERALATVTGRDIAPFHLEGSAAALAALNNEEFPIYVKLHGDFRYQSLKNLAADLATQNAELGKCAVGCWNRFGLIAVGYSGRDNSVMDLLHSALAGSNPFPHGLYWTTLKGRAPIKAVTDLIAAAKAKALKADVIEIETFDSMMSRLWRQLPNRPPELAEAVGRVTDLAVNLALPPAGTKAPILRTNALPLEALPDQCWLLQFESDKDWEALRTGERRSKGAILVTKETEIWAWGREEEIYKAFEDDRPKISTAKFGDRVGDLGSNLFLKGFLEQGLSYALKRGKPLVHRASRSGSTLIVERQKQKSPVLNKLSEAVGGGPVFGQVNGLMTTPSEEHPEPVSVWWAESVGVDLQQIGGRSWVVLRPDVYIWPRWARQDATKFLDKRLRRYNGQADRILSAWIELLMPGTPRHIDHELLAFDGVLGPGNPRFVVNDRTAFTKGARS